MSGQHPPADLLPEGCHSWAAERLLADSEYRSMYEKLLSEFLNSVPFQDGVWYTNMWPACREESERPAVLVLGRATAGQWAERIDRPDFPVDQAIDSAARKDMNWVGDVRSQYMRTALALVQNLPVEYRNHRDEAGLDISWSDLYKIARDGNPTCHEMEIQGSLGAGDLLRREVEVLAPKLVIALTQTFGRKTQQVQTGWFDDLVEPSNLNTKHPNGIAGYAEIAEVPCIVLPHPQGGPKRQRFIEDALHTVESL